MITVLIADDNLHQVESLGEFFREILHCKVVTAKDGRMAQAAIAFMKDSGSTIHLLVTDQNMGEPPLGEEVAGFFKSLYPAGKALLLTGLQLSEQDMFRILGGGTDQVRIKPFSLCEIKGLIREWFPLEIDG